MSANLKLVSGARAIALDDVVITPQLTARPARPRAEPASSRHLKALVALVAQLAVAPEAVMNSLIDSAMALTGAPSAGVSLVDVLPGGGQRFLWVAMGGRYAGFVGGETPIDHSPCGYTVRQGTAQLFHLPGRYFESLAGADPVLHEGLVVPILGPGGVALGTLWVAQHAPGAGFDAEDARELTDLANVAGICLNVLRERDQARAAAAQAEHLAHEVAERTRHRAEFVATVAHELRNPLAPILAATALLGKLNSEEAMAGPLGVIERQSRQLARIIDDLLDLSLMERQALSIRRAPFALGALLAATVEATQGQATAKGQDLHVECADTGLILGGDLQRLTQALANLVGNACKYTQRGGTIRLGAAAVRGRLEIRVEDNGPGIAPELQPRLFDLFSQGAKSLGGQGGLGVGLFVVKRVVDLHGGSLAVRSGGPGAGTCFTISLPIEQPA